MAVVSSLVVLAATATVGFLVYRGAKDTLIHSASDRVAHTAETIKVGTWGTVGAIGDDVRFLAETPPVQGIVRARMRRGLDPLWAIRDDEWGVQLAETFRAFLESRTSYLQARFVGLVDDGMELVRVERRNGRAEFADAADFRALGDATFVRSGADLPPGGLFLSGVVWSDGTENGIPANIPILTISTPVHAANGEVFGVVAVTVDFTEVVAPLESLVDTNQRLYIASDRGGLIHVYASGLPNTELEAPDLLQRLFPSLAAVIEGTTTNVRLLDARLNDGSRGIAYFERIPMHGSGDSPDLLVGVSEPHETILAGVRRVRNTSALITVLLCLAAIGLALSTSRYITNPIRQISKAVAAFGGDGNRVALPVRREDEIGLLARSFEAMERQIHDQMQILEDEERRQRTILETAAEGIIVVDAHGHIETFNPAAEIIFGLSVGDAEGRPVNEIIPSLDLEIEAVTADAPRTATMRTAGRRGDGRGVPLAVVWSAFEWRGEDRYSIFVQDISERKAAEDARERLVLELESERKSLHELSRTLEARVRERTARLEQLNRALNASNRELREITSVASHDLQEPLRKLRSFADLLESEYGSALDETGRFYVQRIFRLAERMSRLLSDLLAFSRVNLEPRRLEKIDLGSLAVAVAEELESTTAHDDGSIYVDDLPEIEADPRQMRELFENLLENALFYRRPDVSPVVHIRGSVQEDASGRRVCQIEVEDNGMGFEQKFVDRIFAPFERVHGRPGPEGTGMGLTICRRIAENHFGSITARSTPGVGSTFVVTLPMDGV